MENKKKNPVASIILTLICILWMYPIVLILVNSLKKEVAITTSGVFSLPTAETWNGVANFVASVTQMDFLKSFWYSLVISVMSVVLIMLCCSMAAWYIVRVNGTLSKVFYYLCVFSMVVPFQMVMFTLAKTADTLHLNNPYNICIIYLGFGAGLAVFMFTGFVKGIPLEIEEAALIDGCTPLQVYFKVLIPILKPTIISTAILELMWVWNGLYGKNIYIFIRFTYLHDCFKTSFRLYSSSKPSSMDQPSRAVLILGKISRISSR